MKHTFQRGVTLVELLLGLAVIAVVLGIVMLLWDHTNADASAYKTRTGFDAILTGVKALYLQPQYANITTTAMIASNKIPQSMVSNANEIVAPWGAQIHISPSALGGPAGSAFDITFDAVPAAQCSPLVQHGGPQVMRVVIGTTIVKDMSADPAIPDPPPDTVVQTCLGSGGQAIVFTST